VIAAGALLALAHFADFKTLAAAWARFDPSLFALAAALYLSNIGVRAWRLRALTLEDGDRPFLAWLRLAATHQVVFTLLPSGTGDFGYPLLAARIVGTKTAPALRVLLVYRFQDLMALLAIAVGGFLLFGNQPVAAPALAIMVLVACTGLFAAADLARLGMLILGRILGAIDFGERISERRRNTALDYLRLLGVRFSPAVRIGTAVGCLVSWGAATASLWLLFAMTGIRLGIGEIMLVIAGMNLVGALATFTVAGLGVSEGGLAVLLALLGHAGGDSAAIALTVRPLALANSLVVCGVVEMIVRLLHVRRRVTKPTGETTGARE